ncbi:MAG TPA: TetR/AcrR family transcriptional regulator [Solirubrobacteraceae bacterium]|nr:TetR/AcrR family transcriptional regulator [Solirubrobacteraceae bacterium]
MIELSATRGYHAVTVTELCSYAGVSPATYYDQFSGKDDCFLAAYRACAEGVFAPMRAAATDGDWPGATRQALDSLLSALQEDPDAGRILFIEALGAGAALRAERARVLSEFERRIEELLERTPPEQPTLDVPLMAVVGALRHIISRHLRTRTEDQLPALLDDGLLWLSSYVAPGGSVRWSTSPDALLVPAEVPPVAAFSPETLPPGTSGLSPSVVARSQRTRLIHATAQVMRVKGYQAATIADIVGAARVARPVFYEHFTDKEGAFLEAQHHPTQFIIDRCAEAYFSAEQWPQRIWRHLQMLLRLIVENPPLSHLRLVECYAAGPQAIRRAEGVTRSFGIFLEEGYLHRPEARALPRLTSQAIAGAIFEIIQRLVAEERWALLPAHLPQLAYIAIAPFTGAQEAIELVEELKGGELVQAPA